MDYNKKIKDFYEGKLTPEEAREFLEFLESPEADEYLSAEIISSWISNLKSKDDRWDSQNVWEKINQNKNGFPRPYLNKETTKSIWIRQNLWKAAVVFFVVGLTSLFFVLNQKDFGDKEGQNQQEFITKVNPRGAKTKVTMEDGSIIYLNSESSITYPKDFKENRNIHLEGEAFFEVVKDPKHPFAVDANGIITTALGTSFNISTFNKGQKVTVTLLTGKVKLNQKGKENFIELNPGEESHLSIYENSMDKYQVSASDRILWIDGILKFEEASFEEMEEILERWYGAEITVQGTPKNLKASGVFDAQESMRNVLQVMSKTLEFEFELNEESVIITFN